MKAPNLAPLVLVIIGGINWGLVGALNFNLVAALPGEQTTLSRVIYVLVGLAAGWQIVPLLGAGRADEPVAQAATGTPARKRRIISYPACTAVAQVGWRRPVGRGHELGDRAQLRNLFKAQR